jgi:hypothetical protein
MSTCFLIARPDPADPERWAGVTGHANGMPTDVGRHLFAHVVTHFSSDPEAAAVHFIDQHVGGWRFLTEVFGRNECYCHDFGEPDADARATHEHAGGIDWTYVMRPGGLEIRRWDYGVVATVPWGQERVDWQAIEEKAYARWS